MWGTGGADVVYSASFETLVEELRLSPTRVPLLVLRLPVGKTHHTLLVYADDALDYYWNALELRVEHLLRDHYLPGVPGTYDTPRVSHTRTHTTQLLCTFCVARRFLCVRAEVKISRGSLGITTPAECEAFGRLPGMSSESLLGKDLA